jgi:protein required for attachment to host cells
MSTSSKPHSHSITWVVVADEAIARILRWDDDAESLEPVEELTDPSAHTRGQDLRREAHGRRTPAASGAQHSVTASAGLDESHQEADKFAHRVARHLEQAWHGHRFQALQLAAAPRFLGLLRKALDAQVLACVNGSVDKDWIHARNDEIARKLTAANLKPAPARPA